MAKTTQRQDLEERLWDMCAYVDSMAHISYMNNGDDIADVLTDYISDLTDFDLTQLLGLTEEQTEWLKECKGKTPEQIELMLDLGKKGILFRCCGRIFRESGPGTCASTCAGALEYGYAPTWADLDEAIHQALDRMEPRLREKKEECDVTNS